MTSRILTIALLCGALYAAVLGVVADAQEKTPTPSPTETATAEPTGTPFEQQTPTPFPSPGETAVEPTPTPFPSPVETAVEPAPTQTAEPTATPGQTATPTATATPGATPTPTATPELAQRERRRTQAPNRSSIRGCLESERKKLSKKSTVTPGRDCEKPRDDEEHEDEHDHAATPAPRPLSRPDGSPAPSNPTRSVATPGAAPIGVPNFFIDKFRIPPFLLSIYQAAGVQYGVRWEVLAAINEIETDYGRNLNVSSAGALGWMQFMPPTWRAYGVDANKDGLKDPYNPLDAIFAAARYLRAAGAETDLRKAIFAYNHADWYVDSVLLRARVIGGLPANFVGSLTGLTQGRFPVAAKATYAGKLKRVKRKLRTGANAAYLVEGNGSRRGIEIFTRAGAPVVAVNDGRIVRVGRTKRLGNFVQLQDVYGNTFTYARLKKIARTYPAPKERTVSRARVSRELALPKRDPKPTAAASKTTKSERGTAKTSRAGGPKPASRRRARTDSAGPAKERVRARGTAGAALPAAMPAKTRLFANPSRPAALAAGGDLQLEASGYEPTIAGGLKLNPRDFEPKRLRKGARVIAGTVLGRVGRSSARRAPHLLFEIRPAGRGAPRIDPKPILDGWKLIESTEIYRAAGKNPFFGPDADTPSIGQILLMSKEALVRRVLANPRIDIYDCGRRDIATGQIDSRVLATLEFLASSGLRPTVSSLKCGHGFYTASGNVSHHSSGNAVDIAAINGTSILGHQGKGSITDLTIQRLLTLQGTMKPDQIISLMTFEGADNTYAMGDHHDHIHVGWRPLFGTNARASRQVNAVLKPSQWIKLIERLGEIDNPTVRETPSKYAVKTVKAAR